MTYNEIVKECKALNYRDKFSLSLLLIQMARKEEEAQNPQIRVPARDKKPPENANDCADRLHYVIESLPRLRPIKKDSLLNSIITMSRFKGGISDKDAEEIIIELEKIKFLKIVNNKRVLYLRK